MKKAILISTMLIIPALAICYNYQDNPSYKIQTDLYNNSYNSKNVNTIMLGDSITYRVQWQELIGNNKQIINRGIDGDTTEGMYNRLDEIIAMHPKEIFIMAGINDLISKTPVNTVYDNYIKIIKKLRENNITVIIQSTLYTASPEINKKVKELDDLLQKYAKDNNIQYINLNKDIAPNGILDTKNSYDGLHLNYNSYNIWKNDIEDFII